jgi:hypothetical protein
MTGVIRERPAADQTDVSKMSRLPLHPKNPERICWGCDRYCSADDLGCANGSIRTPHPVELFGGDWLEFESRASVARATDKTPTVCDSDVRD